jgi:putative transposase
VTLRRPQRLRSFSYTGKYSYFVTFCTRDRKETFDSDEHVECVREQILRTCSERRFAIPAAVFMPDHVHLLVRGLDKDSHFISCMTLARRRSALTYRRTFEADLWQDGYFERVVRDADDERGAIRYIVNNPVRRGLCRAPEDYRYAWSPSFAAREFTPAPEPPESPHG